MAVGAALVMVPSTLRDITSSSFLPHAYCYLYDRQLIGLHVVTDTIIWLSYVAISLTLVHLVRRTRREIPFSWMFLAFGLFIVACGFTHFMEVIVLWKPLYWVSADVKLVTALASVVTAVALPKLVPQVHEMVKQARVSEERKLQLERANRELQHLSARVMAVQDGERRRIARELHDSLGQYLAAVKMSTQAALEQANPETRDRLLHDSLSVLDRCTAEVRTLSYLLHPPLLEEVGLSAALTWYIDGFRQRTGIDVDLQITCEKARLPEDIELALFRVLQESLSNIRRHSGSEVAMVKLIAADESVELIVEDRGRGFQSDAGPQMSGVGIAGMRERMRELGGELRISSQVQGTTVRAILPLQVQARSHRSTSA